MNWKEQFRKELYPRGMDGKPIEFDVPSEAIIQFISTEIIEKLIADIPDDAIIGGDNFDLGKHLKQQLRDKWL